MSTALNVIALISGGKDSLYTILHCVQNGHKIVALANLYPKSLHTATPDAVESEEMNSFMYQTVGQSVIPLYASALSVPLYRQHITGTSIQTGRYYDPNVTFESLDETEDLVPLLRNAMKHHPEANAVCSGAILSTYQRTRIESVAVRLGLIPLAYLWQYPFLPPPPSRPDSLTGLLEDMSSAGCDSRIIKVASGGMPDELLWANIAGSRTIKRILESMSPYFEEDEPGLRGAVLGEGGEFESLALDGPPPVWKNRIDITAAENSVRTEEGGVRWLKVGQARVVARDSNTVTETSDDIVRIPAAIDPQFEHVAARTICTSSMEVLSVDTAERPSVSSPRLDELFRGTNKVTLGSYTVNIANITSHDQSGDAAHQMEQAVLNVKKLLTNLSAAHQLDPPLSPASIISTTILLSAMSSFSSVNASYSQLFLSGLPIPPARVTIACHLPPGVLISLSCTVSVLPRNIHRGLHVQSRSYWAPANIGPYSQAISVPVGFCEGTHHPSFVHVAGQIPLVPPKMEMLQMPFVAQAVLALQHLWRVGQEMGVDLWTWGVAFLPHLDEGGRCRRPQAVAEVWKTVFTRTVEGDAIVKGISEAKDEDDSDNSSGPDAWDLRHNRMGRGYVVPTVGKHRHILPNNAAIANLAHRLWVPPMILAEVEELPRSAPIEWHSHGLGGLPKHPGSKPVVRVASCSFNVGTATLCSYETSRKTEAKAQDSEEENDAKEKSIEADHHFITVQVHRENMTREEEKTHDLPQILERLLRESSVSAESEPSFVHGTAYVSLGHGEAAVAALGGLKAYPGITVIPCWQLWGQSYDSGVNDEDSALVKILSVALTLRMDSYVTHKI